MFQSRLFFSPSSEITSLTFLLVEGEGEGMAPVLALRQAGRRLAMLACMPALLSELVQIFREASC